MMGSQLRMLLGGIRRRGVSSTATILQPDPIRRIEWPMPSLMAEDLYNNPHAELDLLARNHNFVAAEATPVQFNDYIHHGLANGLRLQFIIHDTRPNYSMWFFYRTLWAISPSDTASSSRALGAALQSSFEFIAICFLKDMEELLLSLIRLVFLLQGDEPASISYSLWSFRRSLRARNPSRARHYSSAITIGLQSPAEFLAIIARRYIESILAMLRVAAMAQLETAASIRPAGSTPVQPVRRPGPQFNAELAPAGHWRAPVIAIPLALARQYTRLLFGSRGATSISYSRWAFNMSIRARSVSQAPFSSALSVCGENCEKPDRIHHAVYEGSGCCFSACNK